MKHKTNHNSGHDKRRKTLAPIVYLDIRLLYGYFFNDNYLDDSYKYQKVAFDAIKSYVIDRKVLNDFVNHLINDYRMN